MYTIFKQIHAKCKTKLPSFFQDPKFNGIRIGLNENEIIHCSKLTTLNLRKTVLQSLIPEAFGRGIKQNLGDFLHLGYKSRKIVIKTMKKPLPVEGIISKKLSSTMEFLNSKNFMESEIPSGSFYASARALAILAAMMANQGEALENNDSNLMTKSTWNKMHGNKKRAYDAAHYGNQFKNSITVHFSSYFHEKKKMFGYSIEIELFYILWKKVEFSPISYKK